MSELKTLDPFTQQVVAVLAEHELLPLLQYNNPPSLIAAHQAQGMCHRTTAWVMCYTAALELQQQGKSSTAQTLYNQARQVHDALSREQAFTAFDSVEFTSHIATSRLIYENMNVD